MHFVRHQLTNYMTNKRNKTRRKKSIRLTQNIPKQKKKRMKTQKKPQMTYQVNPIKFAFKAFKFSNSNAFKASFVYSIVLPVPVCVSVFSFLCARSVFSVFGEAKAFCSRHIIKSTSLDGCAFFCSGPFEFRVCVHVCYFDTRLCHKCREELEYGNCQHDVYNNFQWHIVYIRCVLNKCAARAHAII